MFFHPLNGAAPPHLLRGYNTMDHLNLHSLAEATHEFAADTTAAAPTVEKKATAPNAFAQMGLADELLAAVRDLNFTEPTSVQLRAIPLALQHTTADQPANDLLVSSRTGSGKTVAFLLPVLNTMLVERQARDKEEAQAWALKVEQAKANGQEPPKKPRRKNPTDVRHVKPAFPSALVLCPTPVSYTHLRAHET